MEAGLHRSASVQGHFLRLELLHVLMPEQPLTLCLKSPGSWPPVWAKRRILAVPRQPWHTQKEKTAMPDSLAWIADAWRSADLHAGDLYITCARGLSPEQLAERMADHEPIEIGPALTLHEASRMVDLARVYCVGRLGRSGDWSFIVECGGSEGWCLDPAVSLGAEVLIFDPRPDDPPSFFTYLADGELRLQFELGFGYEPSGAQRDLLRPALEAAGVVAPDDSLDDLLGEGEELSSVEHKRRTLKAAGEHFGLSLPQQLIEDGRLPVVVTRTSPPSSW
jgi:hypothetical protein